MGDVAPGLLRPIDERETDPRFLCLVPAHGVVELGNCLKVFTLRQGRAVREARKRA